MFLLLELKRAWVRMGRERGGAEGMKSMFVRDIFDRSRLEKGRWGLFMCGTDPVSFRERHAYSVVHLIV